MFGEGQETEGLEDRGHGQRRWRGAGLYLQTMGADVVAQCAGAAGWLAGWRGVGGVEEACCTAGAGVCPHGCEWLPDRVCLSLVSVTRTGGQGGHRGMEREWMRCGHQCCSSRQVKSQPPQGPFFSFSAKSPLSGMSTSRNSCGYFDHVTSGLGPVS